VVRNGAIVPSLVPGAFTVTVVDPLDTVTSTPAVVESSVKPGVYYYDIPAAFLTTNGAGKYIATVEVRSLSPFVTASYMDPLFIEQSDIDVIFALLERIRKETMNKTEIDFTTQEEHAYDDNGTTIIQTWDVETDGGELATTQLGVITKRGPPKL
jgi:hypothetical protein